MLELVRAAKAIVLVTHDMSWVTEYCNRAMLIEQGHVIAEGEPAEVVGDPPGALGRERAEKAAESGGPLTGGASSSARPGAATSSRSPRPAAAGRRS